MTEKADKSAEATPRPRDDAHTLTLPGDPATNKAAARKLHGPGLGGMVYGNAVAHRMKLLCGGFDVGDSGCNYIADLLERMAPRDPLEEMLVVQAALAHARVLHLTEHANRQERLESIRTVNECADRASNTYRRLMLALREYRKPPRSGDTFTAIRQANIAGQQVVQNGEISGSRNATNEQGSKPPEAPQALPADPGGVDVLARLSRPREAVGGVHRAEDARGQGPKPDERPPPR
ncbi:MAG: hypothetical protein HND58_14745 [Planctomycetota bacterium]|nr:MAG: hypothetical protein HND58_14745 [Planctomycetota bacterium]